MKYSRAFPKVKTVVWESSGRVVGGREEERREWEGGGGGIKNGKLPAGTYMNQCW